MAATWRKRKGVAHDTWHHCSNCSNWPTSDFDERYTKPTNGEECDQCLAKMKAKNCS